MPQEIWYGLIVFVWLVIANWPISDNEQAIQDEHQVRYTKAMSVARRRYVNVIKPIPPPPPPPPEVTIQTVRHKISGMYKGTGNGGATMEKS
jgi:hypothetical protein